MISPAVNRSCFVYGTLMSSDVLRILLGRVPSMIPNAILLNHARHPVLQRVYPGVIQKKGSAVEGVLLLDITSSELTCLDYFEEEGVEYKRSIVHVQTPADDNVETNAYIWARGPIKLDVSCDWDYDKFLRENLDSYLTTTVKPCRDTIEKKIMDYLSTQ